MIATAYTPTAGLWQHQAAGITETVDAILAGDRRIVLTSPCGGGKTRMMTELIEWAAGDGMPSALYTSRKMLFSQTAGVLERHGIEFGRRASGHEPALLRDVQLCMTMTELAAVYKRKRRELHNAKLVLVDEIHMQGGGAMQQIMQDHYDSGAAIVAFTATPLDLEGEWDRLIVAGTNSELRACGAHVPAVCYCPDQPDLKHIKQYKVGEDLTDKDNHKAIMRPGVFGRVLKHWKQLNPDGKPTILFAPDVDGSIYFAKEFHRAGIRAAHIDAKNIWLDGESIPSDDDNRKMILAGSEDGSIPVLTNRFVLREGIDLPHISHCVMACVFGSLTSYLQSGGRVIRAHHSLDHVTIQDHGGNYIRHGSLNSDREWELGQSSYRTTGIRQDGMREKPETEPIICPKCGAGRLAGPKCHACGYAHQRRSRIVVQVNGDLKEVDGPSFRKRVVKVKLDTADRWKRFYFSQRRSGRTFNQAVAWFFHEEHYWPPKDMPLMPRDPGDWYEKIQDVPSSRLHSDRMGE